MGGGPKKAKQKTNPIQILNKKQPTNQLMNSFVSKQNWPSPQGLSLASIALAFAMPRLPFFGLGT